MFHQAINDTLPTSATFAEYCLSVGKPLAEAMQETLDSVALLLGETAMREGFLRPGMQQLFKLVEMLKSQGYIDYVVMYTFAKNRFGTYARFVEYEIIGATRTNVYDLLLTRSDMNQEGYDHAMAQDDFGSRRYVKKSLEFVKLELEAKFLMHLDDPQFLMFDDLPRTIVGKMPKFLPGYVARDDEAPARDASLFTLDLPGEVSGVSPYHWSFTSTPEISTPASSLFLFCLIRAFKATTMTREQVTMMINTFIPQILSVEENSAPWYTNAGRPNSLQTKIVTIMMGLAIFKRFVGPSTYLAVQALMERSPELEPRAHAYLRLPPRGSVFSGGSALTPVTEK